MKATVTVTLDGKEVRAIIAKTLGLPITDVKSLRYNFAIEGHSAEEVAAKIKAAVGDCHLRAYFSVFGEPNY